MMELWRQLDQYQIAGISGALIIRSAGIILGTLVVRAFIARKIMDFFAHLAKRTTVEWDDLVIDVSKPQVSQLILVFGIWSALRILPLPTEPFYLHNGIDLLAKLLIIGIFTALALKYVRILEGELKKNAANPDYWMDMHLIPLMSIGLKALIGITVFVITAQTLGYSVSALVASLGIGGVAVALAAKDTLANFFGSVMVMIDKPFRIGETIKAGDFTGVVEEIGFRSTRIRTLDKTLMVVPNEKIASMNIENLTRIADTHVNMRRVNFVLGLEYKAAARIETAVEELRAILAAHPMVAEENRQVFFSAFGESSLNILVNYFVKTGDFARFMGVKQEINLAMMRKLADIGLSPAFPSRTVYLEQETPKKQ